MILLIVDVIVADAVLVHVVDVILAIDGAVVDLIDSVAFYLAYDVVDAINVAVVDVHVGDVVVDINLDSSLDTF